MLLKQSIRETKKGKERKRKKRKERARKGKDRKRKDNRRLQETTGETAGDYRRPQGRLRETTGDYRGDYSGDYGRQRGRLRETTGETTPPGRATGSGSWNQLTALRHNEEPLQTSCLGKQRKKSNGSQRKG